MQIDRLSDSIKILRIETGHSSCWNCAIVWNGICLCWRTNIFFLFCLFVCFLLALAIIQHRVIARNKSLRISFLIHGINYWVIWLEDLLLGCNLKRRSPVRLFIAWVFFCVCFTVFRFFYFCPLDDVRQQPKQKPNETTKKKKEQKN